MDKFRLVFITSNRSGTYTIFLVMFVSVVIQYRGEDTSPGGTKIYYYSFFTYQKKKNRGEDTL